MKRGLTLIEIIVSVAIFAMVAFVLIGALLVATSGSQRVQATRTAVDNISFVMEDMVRSARLAVNHWCGDGSPVINSGLVEPGTCVNGERLAFNMLIDGEAGGVIQYRLDTNSGVIEKWDDDWMELSLSTIKINRFDFTAEEALSNGQIPLIRINIEALIDDVEYNVQTSVHPRFSEYVNP